MMVACDKLREDVQFRILRLLENKPRNIATQLGQGYMLTPKTSEENASAVQLPVLGAGFTDVSR